MKKADILFIALRYALVKMAHRVVCLNPMPVPDFNYKYDDTML